MIIAHFSCRESALHAVFKLSIVSICHCGPQYENSYYCEFLGGVCTCMAQLMSLPLTVSCSNKIQITFKIQIDFTFLVPAHQTECH